MTKKITKLMLNGEEYEIREYQEWWWQPWANTIAYYPLDSTNTVNDLSGNSNTLTNVWVNFTTYNGVSCARITWNADNPHNPTAYLYWNISWLPTWANPRTYNLWIYQDNAASSRNATYIFQWTASSNRMVYVAQWIDASGNAFISQYGSSSSNTPPTIWQRHNIVVVYNWSKFVYYVNAVEKFSWTYTINTSGNNVSIWWTSENQGWNSFNWAFSNVILEDKAWTVQEVSDYFNQTKWDYWIS